jgi:acyl-CoA reductase-like NAD-dependent aldehyde dehydrogenase
METVQLLIGGKFRPAINGATFDRLNPITQQVVTRAAAASEQDADAAVAAAQAVFPAWAALGPGERRKLLLKAADLLEQHTPDFIAIGVQETGAAPGWYGFNVMLAAGMLREARDGDASASRCRVGHRPVERPGDPWCAGPCDASGLRQHGRAQSVGSLPGRAFSDW